jgi:hypothetical protein
MTRCNLLTCIIFAYYLINDVDGSDYMASDNGTISG